MRRSIGYGFEGLYGTTNDPKNGPQMILDRKWSPISSAKWSQKESKIRMAGTQVTGSSCHVYYHNKKNLTSQITAKKKVITVDYI